MVQREVFLPVIKYGRNGGVIVPAAIEFLLARAVDTVVHDLQMDPKDPKLLWQSAMIDVGLANAMKILFAPNLSEDAKKKHWQKTFQWPLDHFGKVQDGALVPYQQEFMICLNAAVPSCACLEPYFPCLHGADSPEGESAKQMMDHMASMTTVESMNGFTLAKTDEFSYLDPVDKSLSLHQGIRFIFTDGSRVVFRLSGTGVSGATIRMYVEKFEPSSGDLHQVTATALRPLIQVGLELSRLQHFTGRTEPTVIT